VASLDIMLAFVAGSSQLIFGGMWF
jgi:hypothetical protein